MNDTKTASKNTLLPLFSGADDWQNNACLGFYGENMDCYARGYKKAADTLAEEVIRTSSNQDILVYPILFLYRHYLELRLKEIVMNGRRLLGNGHGFPTNHQLGSLWSIVKGIARKVWLSPDPPEFQSIDHIISEYSKVDDGSFAFRYPTDRDGEPTLDGIQQINIRHAAEMISEAATFLDGVSTGLGVYLDSVNESH